MKIKSEKGYTGIDIAISVVVLFIFVSLIAVLSYNFNSRTREIELASEATYLAIDEIENIKNAGFEAIQDIRYDENNPYIDKETETAGFFEKVIVKDYADIKSGDSTIVPNLVKQVTVEISYMFKGKTETVELSTILSK